jgi:hypothetical protein
MNRPLLCTLLALALLPAGTARAATVGTVFVIDMENHNLTQPNPGSSPQQLMGNPAAPYLNSLMTPGNVNSVQTSWASNYYNVGFNRGLSIHPSEPNYIWQEGGSNYGVTNDNQPYQSPGGTALPNGTPSLSGLLQAKGITWKSYQEDIDLAGTGSSKTSTVLPRNQWTVPLSNLSGTSSLYTNPYNNSHQYDFAAKHDGHLFFPGTSGGNDPTPSNPQVPFFAPLQQLQTDLTNNTVASYNQITPDQFNDMHTGLTNGFTYHGTLYTGDQAAIAQGDNFLSMIVPQIMASQAYQNNGAIIIWFDETEGGSNASFTLPEIVISPLARGNAYQSPVIMTHSSDLRTLQNLFQVSAPQGGYLGDAGTPGTNDLSDLFLPGAVPQDLPAPEPSTLALFALGGAALAGWRRWRRK